MNKLYFSTMIASILVLGTGVYGEDIVVEQGITSNQIILESGDSLINNGSIINTEATGIVLPENSLVTSLNNNGNINAKFGVVLKTNSNISSFNNNGRIDVEATGIVLNDKTYITTLYNNGNINAESGIILNDTSHISSLYNNGNIDVDTTGIALKSESHVNSINNNGSINSKFGIVLNDKSDVTSLNNDGNIDVDTTGIVLKSESNITSFNNNGRINAIYGIVLNEDSHISSLNNNGSINTETTGIVIKDNSFVTSLNNLGKISATNNGIYINDSSSNTFNNAGIIAGNTPVKGTSNGVNYGMYYDVDDHIITIGESGTFNGYTILNAATMGKIATTPAEKLTNDKGEKARNSYINASNLSDYSSSNLIINGLGDNETGALTVDTDFTLSNSILNGYKKALYVNKNMTFTGNDLIINGNIGGNEYSNITLNSSTINGNIFGVDGKTTTLTLGGDTNIFNDITNIKTLNINGEVTLFENAKLKRVKNIIIDKYADLFVSIAENSSGDFKVSSLVGNNGTISGEGDLVISSVGVQEGKFINFGKTAFAEGFDNYILSSLFYTLEATQDNKLKVIKSNLVLDNSLFKYEKSKYLLASAMKDADTLRDLNSLIETLGGGNQSITKALSQEASNQENAQLLANYYDSTYGENIFSRSHSLSLEAIKNMKDLIVQNDFITEYGETTTYGGAFTKQHLVAETGKVNDDKSFYTGYGVIEKGVERNKALGFVLGGSIASADIGTSKVEGNLAYLGLYGKTYGGKFDFIYGLNAHYGSYEGTRDFFGHSHEDNYSDYGVGLYINALASKEIKDNLFLDYGMGLAYTRLTQNDIQEDGTALAMSLNSKSFDQAETNVNVGLRKEIVNKLGSADLKLGVKYSYTFIGEDEDYLVGSYAGVLDTFEVLINEDAEDSVKLELSYNLEMNNGLNLNASVAYDVATSSKYSDEVVGQVGIMKKF